MADEMTVPMRRMEPETVTYIMTFPTASTAQPPSDENLTKSTSLVGTNTPKSSTSIPICFLTGPLVKGSPVQTTMRALTTIFTPRLSCQGRFYLESSSTQYNSRDIFSDGGDRLYRGCQPDPEAYMNYYSPGACPYNMYIATVSSYTQSDPTSATYVDICCHSGFYWDYRWCHSIAWTKMTVLIAPVVSTKDLFTTVSQVDAWHPPILAVWQTIDISLFPSEVMREKSSIAEYGWVNSTSSITSAPSESSPPSSEQSNPSSEQSNESTGRSLGTGAIIGIAIGAVAFVCLFVAFVCLYRRRRRPQNKPSELNAAFAGTRRKTWLRNAWRVGMSSPVTTSQIPDSETNRSGRKDCPTIGDKQYVEKQAPIELDGGPVVSLLDGFGSQGHESTVSPISDRVTSFNPAP